MVSILSHHGKKLGPLTKSIKQVKLEATDTNGQLRRKEEPGVVAHSFKPSTREAEAGKKKKRKKKKKKKRKKRGFQEFCACDLSIHISWNCTAKSGLSE